jgi:2-desacetyl-2-hydroxyethyl bacteriochlorophyllide A dehydrogenase
MGKMTKNVQVVFEKPMKVVLKETKVPKPGPKEVLIRTTTTLISTGTELSILTGKYIRNPATISWIRYPYNAGYCNIGEVVELGSEVSSFRVGDIVAGKGNHVQFFVADVGELDMGLIKVPKTVSQEEASFAVIAAGVLNSVRLSGASVGNSVVIFGLGLLGQFACLWSKFAGGFPVIAVDVSSKRLEIAKENARVNFALNAKEKDVKQEIEKITQGRMADIVFEVSGNAKLIPQELELVKRQGKFIVLGSPREKVELDLHYLCNSPSKQIIGTHFGSAPEIETPYNQWTKIRNTKLYIDLLAEKIISTKKLVTHRFSWKEAVKAYEFLVEDRTRALGVILDWKS